MRLHLTRLAYLANNVADVRLLLEVMAGPDEYDSTVSMNNSEVVAGEIDPKKKYRFAYFDSALNHPTLDPEIASSINARIKQLKNDGHTVNKVEFDLMDYIAPAYYVLTTAEASSNLSRFDGIKFGFRDPDRNLDLSELYKKTRSTGFGKEVKRRILLGTFVLSAGYYEAYFTRAQKVRKLVIEKIRSIFVDADFILLPTSPGTAFKAGEKMEDPIAMYLADIYTVTANLAGIPAISLPLFMHTNGMPFGLQVMANRHEELSLLLLSTILMKTQASRNTGGSTTI